MVKWAHIFLLFLKINENNLYLFSKNCSLFHLIFKHCFQITMVKHCQKILKTVFYFLFLKKKKLFLNHMTKQVLFVRKIPLSIINFFNLSLYLIFLNLLTFWFNFYMVKIRDDNYRRIQDKFKQIRDIFENFFIKLHKI